jgi:hypothetical protein
MTHYLNSLKRSRWPRYLLMLSLASLLSLTIAQVRLESDLVLDLTVAAGGSYDGTLTLRNTGEEPATVSIYLSDYMYDAEGASHYPDPGTLPRSNAAWLELPQSSITVPAGQVINVTYRINVPDDSAIEGTYWSLLFVEPAPANVPTAANSDAPAFTLKQVVRYGVQVTTTVESSGEAVLSFVNPNLQQSESGTILQVDLENQGERFLNPMFRVELYDQNGVQTGSFEGRKRRLLPGTSIRQQFEFDALEAGTYTAIVIADAGGNDIFGSRYSIQVTP